jgi:hypothetical protein
MQRCCQLAPSTFNALEWDQGRFRTLYMDQVSQLAATTNYNLLVNLSDVVEFVHRHLHQHFTALFLCFASRACHILNLCLGPQL